MNLIVKIKQNCNKIKQYKHIYLIVINGYLAIKIPIKYHPINVFKCKTPFALLFYFKARN